MRQSVQTRDISFLIAKGIVACSLLIGCTKDDAVAATNNPVLKVEKPKADNPSPAMAARRAVKGTTDADAAKIDKNVKDTTIEDLIKNKGEGEYATRQAPFETSTWRVKATIESIELKKDGDFYMVMRGEKGGETVVEVPDPKTCKGSPFEADITKTRKELEDKFHPTKDKKTVNETASVTGVGFLGFSANPKKKGSGGNVGSRLMPGTDIKFDSKNAGG